MIEPQVTDQLKSELVQLDAIMLKAEQDFKPLLDKVHPSQYQSACNLLHYLTLRSKDIRGLQDTLHQYGFSSLASSESHIHSQLLAILNHLDPDYNKEAAISYMCSKELVMKRSLDLF
ncbi:MAG: pyruvate kinase, partial [Flavisolibacter sp.]|nr:pyruvate kinase [Flavisolibacter sp.]